MFTGIVKKVGRVRRVDGPRLVVETRLKGLKPGDSVAVEGTCLTVAGLRSGTASFDVGPETFARTSLGKLKVGDAVNLEPALTPSTPLGGHLVLGHVDAVARILARTTPDRAGFVTMRFSLPPSLARFVALKGSVAVDGVSLTVAALGRGRFETMLVPHTLSKTTLGRKGPGDDVNLEVDLLARYLERQLEARK